MSTNTKIQWCDATVNFWWGCAKVSAGCKFCYAENLSRRLGRGRATWGLTGQRWLRVAAACGELVKLDRQAEKRKTRLRVFINSMSDTFEARSDLEGARQVLYAIARCVPHLDLLLLTKRIGAVESLVPADWRAGHWPRNVWLGFSAEGQREFDNRWPVARHLGRRYGVPCIFCSAEPLIGPLDFSTAQFGAGGDDEPELRPLDWLILGGESGVSARPCGIDWIRDAVSQARRFEIPVFVKQLGARPMRWDFPSVPVAEVVRLRDSHGGDPNEWPAELRVRELPVPSLLNGVQEGDHS